MDNYDRQILLLTDTELERFVREWVDQKKTKYFETARFSGSGDLGRDVVGFLSPARHEGGWHNYQCKQYGKSLPIGDGIREIGKVLYHAFLGKFTPPEAYFFVAPRGVSRPLENLIFNPGIFKHTLLKEWDKYCANSLVSKTTIPLVPELARFIDEYDFSKITRIDLDSILNDPSSGPVLSKRFGADPGPAPKGSAPSDVQSYELVYVGQLVEAYRDCDGVPYTGHNDIHLPHDHGVHLARQRERFHDAEAFKRFYRDSTQPDVLNTLADDVFHGVIDVCESSHLNKLRCVEAVMAQAASLPNTGMLMKYTGASVKQGICHHFANENRLRWRR